MATFNPDDPRFKKPASASTQIGRGRTYEEAPSQYDPTPQYGSSLPYVQQRHQLPQQQQPSQVYQAPAATAAAQLHAQPASTAQYSVPVQKRQSGWSTGLYDCLEHADSTCIVTYFFPCITYGRIVNKLRGSGSEGACLAYCCIVCWLGLPCAACLSAPTRSELRAKYNLEEEPCSDCTVSTFCCVCALCQEIRELDARDGISNTQLATMYNSPQQQTMRA